MSDINNLNFEVWYQFSDKSTPRRLAAFSFRFEAEKYIELFHPNDSKFYSIIDTRKDEEK